MNDIPSPHGGLLYHRHNQHEGALREHDRHSYDAQEGHGERHRDRHGHGERHAERRGERHRFGPRGRGRGGPRGYDERRGHSRAEYEHGHDHHHRHGHGRRFGRGQNPLAAGVFDREGASEVAQVAYELHAATRSLLHAGSPEQLAEGQRLLEETRRALYLILASEPAEPTAPTAQAVAEPGTGSTAPSEVDENPET